ncbi:low molecular weight protein arginine phosphatase [Listeria seeligeri]|uniref:low molecular weight protein arginine phosphatase n=1 Tax=Listeria seeligeri TaxID=1640 RepID=UPI0016294E3B|nr:low molecular weight protein arginine phosphatase [Listeria seeligeri]MBC1424822.1 low molecular weight protein arginine phosphatase [Listeria seeligeri]MBC1428937.1 low molecular weight protein arginine phosphatase [Listeria seeligeri]MBC1532900.1 low molecular weight protein arginine phosphatase [Listeria seeligeri]MBC1726800.1 low molecular weight protein arginine phosphatase [Listeria seeligeri]MBC1734274.1 low molecular weight protein arginine phosphatase [Listeria seeligeri]
MNVLFVCTGNTCRSPLAEKILKDLRPDIAVRSAGTHAVNGDAISEKSKQILLQMDLETDHQAKKLNQVDIDWANEIYTMTKAQVQELQMRFPNSSSKIKLVTEDNSDIPDPYGGSIEQYEITYYELKSAISERFL